MNKRYIFYTFLCAFTVSQICAQNEKKTFSAYSHYVSKAFSVTWKKPHDFTDLKQSAIPWGPGIGKGGGRTGMLYASILQSKDGDCLVLYPDMDMMLASLETRNGNFAYQMLINELTAALNLSDRKEHLQNTDFNFDKYVMVLHDEETKKVFNADTVYIAQIPLLSPYRNKYLYCTGLYIVKTGRPSMILKCFFTEQGELKKEKFLRELCKRVKYKNEKWIYDSEKCTLEKYKYYLKTR